MTNILAYLTFNGNCREAMNFYRECLGGNVEWQTVGESPLGQNMPTRMKECILQATLIRDNLVLMGSDMVAESGLQRGNSVSLMLNCASEAEFQTFYAKLSENGKQTCPPSPTFWGALFGELTDQFGNHWLLHYQGGIVADCGASFQVGSS